MDVLALGIGLVLGLLVGAAVVFVRLNRAAQDQRQTWDQTEKELQSQLSASREERAALVGRLERLTQLETELAAKVTAIEGLQEELSAFREERRGLETQLAERERALEEQKKLLEEAQVHLKESFEALSSQALRANNQQFLDLAKEHLQTQQKEGKGELEKKQQAIEELVKPLTEGLKQISEKVQELEVKREGAYATLGEQVKSLMETQTTLQKETRNLVQALRAPNQRGQWGELQLRRVVEMAGMLEYVDFDEQVNMKSEEGRLRPDMVIKLPNERVIVVDAKTPLDAYIRAIEATEEEDRRAQFAHHARQVRDKVASLGAKNYMSQFKQTPDFVVLFLPGEPVFSAALESDGALIEFGVDKKVLIATPTTLIALLRAVAYGWRSEALAKDAQRIASVGEELYNRIVKMTDHFNRVGKNLESAVGAYNDMVGSLESRVLPKAREIKELQQNTTLAAMEEPKAVERRPRAVQAPEMLPLPGFEE